MSAPRRPAPGGLAGLVAVLGLTVAGVAGCGDPISAPGTSHPAGGSAGTATPADSHSTGTTATTASRAATTVPTTGGTGDDGTPDTAGSGDGTGEDTTMSEIHLMIDGGFTGQIRELRIDPDGSATADVSGAVSERAVDPDALTDIRAGLDASGLFGGTDLITTAPPGADLQRYQITYRGTTVVVYDTAVPDGLVPAIELLEAELRGG